ncbi:MAG: class C beta-lactamase-related serine hydrolase [Gammaproteobacteria bacterium]|nr:class C beta-lactamase-related serine hydrolase [Gammaproteobacteria bacterium]
MKFPSRIILAFFSLLPVTSFAQQAETYDYWAPQRELVQRGMQAVFMCNGIFTGKRTLEQVFAQELAYLNDPIGTPAGGGYTVDRELRMVEVGTAGAVPVMRAVFREGIGCVIMAPDQTIADINRLPELTLPLPPGDAAQIPWPNGDLIENSDLPANIDAAALQAASDWAFNRASPEQVTLSLIVVYKGEIIHERYAPGIDMTTRTRTWSTAKSIAATLIGMLVDQGRMSLDAPLGFDWLPANSSPETDPRNEITLRHVLNMSSGLQTIDNRGMEYATGSGLSYWAGASSVAGARSRALTREPGTYWDYENYDTLLGVYAMKQALGGEKAYAEFPRKALMDKIGMRNTLVSADRFGDFILSSQVYTNARDLARFGLLYLNNGIWDGERLISEEWIDFSRTPAPATVGNGGQYGGQWWLVPEGRTDVPTDAYSTNGNRGQYTVVVPSHDVVIVRRGLDYGKQGFSQWDLTREVLKAVN